MEPVEEVVQVGTIQFAKHLNKGDDEGKRIEIAHTKEGGVIIADLAIQYLVMLDSGQEAFVFKKDNHLIEK